MQYTESIKRKDTFFSHILNDFNEWKQYHTELDSSTMRNDNFIKNLGIFVKDNYSYKQKAYDFLQGWEPARIGAMDGWVKKAYENKYILNYFELLKWSKENKIECFILLLQEQTKHTFLDNYELYYLEDEKVESNCLIYYPEKNYFVQKSMYEMILNIYYDCKENGVDLIKELNLNNIDKWELLSFKKQLSCLLDQLKRIFEEENRIKLVFNINYEPTDNKFIYYNKKKFFNTYNKTKIWDYNKPQSNYGFPLIKELIMNLVGEDDKSYKYFNRWLGWQIQNPTEKLPTAIIFQGRQGSGKGTFKTHVLDNIFGENCQEINQTHLESAFNEYLLGKQMIVANEVMHNENRQTLPNVLKNLVTDPEITISRKFRKEIKGKNFTHWIFCTNSDNPIRIDQDDRRYSVFYSEKLKGGGKKAAKFVQALQNNLDYELKQYISYLKSLTIKFYDIHEPIMTDAKAEIIELNKDSVEKFKEALLQFSNLGEAFISIYGHLDQYYIDKEFGDGKEYILTEKIYLLYDKWCEKHKEKGVFSKQNFSKKLANNGCKSLPKWKEDRTFRMYDIEDLNKLMVKSK